MSGLTATATPAPVAVEELAFAFFQRKVLRLAGLDLRAYKGQQMRRRLNTIMVRNRAANLFEYARLLDQPDRLREFLDFFTINVSEFFRIPDKFDYLAARVLPGLLSAGAELRLWSAGCSNGAEPYSLAILLDELAPHRRWSVLATDVDRTILARAERGDRYTPADLRNVSERRLSRYFERSGADYRVKDALRRRVRFQAHDLLRDPFDTGFRLIACRHVVIYFTDEAKELLYRRFAGSLEEGGVLFVGGTEMVARPRESGFEPMAVSFYRKTGSG